MRRARGMTNSASVDRRTPKSRQKQALRGRRRTFETNVCTLTHSKMLSSALCGWQVIRTVSGQETAPDEHWLSCELCGTRFREGAYVRHVHPKVEIFVGGTCLKTLMLEAFQDKRALTAARREVERVFLQNYVRPPHAGAWRTWVFENAKGKLAHSAAQMKFLKAALDPQELLRLIRFHDRTRLFPRSALLPEWKLLPRGVVPRKLTIIQARALLRSHRGALLGAWAEHTWQRKFKVDGVPKAWRLLLAALYRISCDHDKRQAPAVAQAVAGFAGSVSDYWWNSSEGLAKGHGCAGESVRLRILGAETSDRYFLGDKWHPVSMIDDRVLHRLLKVAFGDSTPSFMWWDRPRDP